MLEIVLLILKIAGIILAVILGILIIAVCCALFVPVRYRGDFSVSDGAEGGKKNIGASFRAAWLLRLIRVYVSYDRAVRVRVKLLFFTLMDTARDAKVKNPDKEKEKEDEEKRENKKEDEKKRKDKKEKENERESEDKKEDIQKASSEEAERKESDGKAEHIEENGQRESEREEGDRGDGQAEEPSGKEKKTIKSRIYNILQTIRNFCDKLKEIKKKAEKAGELWSSDHMVRSRSLLGKQFGYLLKHTKPKKLEGYLQFGFEDPSTTGYIMAVYGILYPIWSPKLSVEPDFEKQVLACHIILKGKIRAWHFVRAALGMLLSKDVRHVIKDVKKF